MQSKLQQMDRVLRGIVEALPPDTLLLVFGDHGMTADGNHGGETHADVQ